MASWKCSDHTAPVTPLLSVLTSFVSILYPQTNKIELSVSYAKITAFLLNAIERTYTRYDNIFFLRQNLNGVEEEDMLYRPHIVG